MVTQLKDAKFFSVEDAKTGYWHGRFRFIRLPFGLVVSQDVFQKHLDSAQDGLKEVTGIADDTFVFGATEKEHDESMVNLVNRSREKGIKFNKDKIQFKCQEVSSFGHKWTPDELRWMIRKYLQFRTWPLWKTAKISKAF